MTKRIGGGWLALVSLLLAAVAMPALASPPGESALDHLQPRIDRTQFAALVGPLQLDQSQRFVAEMLFNDYAAAISQLAEEVDAEADRAGRERMAEALAGRGRMDAEQLRATRIAVLEVYRRHWEGSDALLEELLESLRGILSETQRRQLEQPLVDLWRELLLRPRQARERSPEYAGDGLDVIELMEAAKSEELSAVRPEALAPVQAAYGAEMNVLLLETALADRAGAMAQRIARIRGDEPARREAERLAIFRWQRLEELNRRIVARVGQLAGAAGGEAARQRWQERVRRSAFPWMYRDQRVERCIDWINKQDLESDVLQAAMRIEQAYEARRSQLVEEAITAMIQGRLQQKRIIHPLTGMSELNDAASRELYERLLKNSGERSALEADTVAKLEALLHSDQRREMRRIAR